MLVQVRQSTVKLCAHVHTNKINTIVFPSSFYHEQQAEKYFKIYKDNRPYLSSLDFGLCHLTNSREASAYTRLFGENSIQPRSQALSSMRRRGGKTLVGAGHVIDGILIA